MDQKVLKRGIGEANVSLLGQIAEVGLGKVRTVGLAKAPRGNK